MLCVYSMDSCPIQINERNESVCGILDLDVYLKT